MLEQISYINHLNEKLECGKDMLFVNENELHDFTWDIISKNDSISGFKRGVVSKNLTIILKCSTEQEGIKLKNKLFEVCEKDVLAVKPGKIVIGDYYISCFITESKKTNYLLSKKYMQVSVKVTTDKPYWVKEVRTLFKPNASEVGKNMDYNRDFPTDYSSNTLSQQLHNTNFVPSNFKLLIFGACTNPSVVINGNEYSVNVALEDNEYLEIDSIEKTIITVHNDGTTTNCFNFRNRNSYIFEKIAPGLLNTSNNGNFMFEVVLFEERSEPKWT